MNDTPFAFTLAEARGLIRRPRFWLVFAGVTALIVLTGPFGTYGAMTLADRALYWVLATLGSFWLGFFTSMTVAGMAEDREVTPWPATALGGLAASVPVAVFLGALDALFFEITFLAGFRAILPYTCVIAPIVALLYEVVEARAATEPDLRPPEDGAGWLSKLPPEIGTDLVLLQAQDHYVLAQTVAGQALVRSSVSEAEDGLGGRGLRVHRSWWVAHDHIDRMVYRDGSPRLVLTNGALVPVGRAYRRAVRSSIASRAG